MKNADTGMGAACWFAEFCCSQEIQEEAEESEWIGYNTMIRFKEASEAAAKGIEESPTGGPEVEAAASPGGAWSTVGQRDPDSEE